MFFKVHILDVSWGFPHIFPNISRFFKMPSIGGDEASKQDWLLEESRSSQLEGPAGNFFRSTKYQTNKKKQNIFGIANEKYLHFYWDIYIYIVVVSIHQQFFGGLDFQGRNQLEPTRKKLRSVRVTGIWRKFMAPVPLPVPSFKPPPGGWEEGIRQVVVSCVGNGGRARNMLGDDFWIP